MEIHRQNIVITRESDQNRIFSLMANHAINCEKHLMRFFTQLYF